MGCFPVLKGKKKKSEQAFYVKRVNPQDHPPTALPEPPTQTRTLQSAPPSFRNRVKPIVQNNRVFNSRTRALSAPSSLHGPEQDAISSIDCDEQEESKSQFGSKKERLSQNAQPLPLPSPRSATAILMNQGSFKVLNSSGPLDVSGPLPLPPAPSSTLSSMGTIRNFSFEELAVACQNFCLERLMSEGLSCVIYRATFGDDNTGSRKLEATVTDLLHSGQALKDFVNEVNTLSSLQHPYLCKLLGFHAREGSERRMLVYERLHHGSLDGLLYGRADGPPIDWNSRMKVALCAAQGLTFLHEEGPFQAMFDEFSTSNIQIDKDYSAKLSGYGCVSHNPEIYISSNLVARANVSVETLERGLLTPKSNVWSFGIVLLELLTGRKNLEKSFPKEERNLVKWTRPYLADDGRLSLIMDPQLKGRYPIKAAGLVAEIARKCLQTDPSERPTMRTIVEHFKIILDMKTSCLFPLQEPGSASAKNMSRSPSLNGIIIPGPRLNFSASSTTRLSVSPTRTLRVSSSLPPRSCSSTISMDVFERQGSRKSTSSSARRSSVEGF